MSSRTINSTVETLDENKVKLSVEVDEAEFDSALDAAFKRIAKEVRMPGFRPGKAPRRLLEAQFGHGVGREEALREALPDYYAQAVVAHDVDVIAPARHRDHGRPGRGRGRVRCGRRDPPGRRGRRLRRAPGHDPQPDSVG